MLSQNKFGRPSLGTIPPPVNESDTQGHLDHPLEYLIRQCALFCQKPGGKLNEVQYKATGKIMLSVAKKHDDDSVLR